MVRQRRYCAAGRPQPRRLSPRRGYAPGTRGMAGRQSGEPRLRTPSRPRSTERESPASARTPAWPRSPGRVLRRGALPRLTGHAARLAAVFVAGASAAMTGEASRTDSYPPTQYSEDSRTPGREEAAAVGRTVVPKTARVAVAPVNGNRRAFAEARGGQHGLFGHMLVGRLNVPDMRSPLTRIPVAARA